LPDDAEIRSATRTAEARLPQPARTERRPGVGVVIVHRGAEALWVIVAWWEVDILCHRLFRTDLGTVDLRSFVTARAPSGCWRAEAAIRKAADGGRHVPGGHPCGPARHAQIIHSGVPL
jgi:hypothetical protein